MSEAKSNGHSSPTVLDRVSNLIHDAHQSGYLPPSRAIRPGDICLGSASGHIRALRTARAKIEAEIAPIDAELKVVAAKLLPLIPERRDPNQPLEDWLNKHPDAKLLYDQGTALNNSARPKRELVKLLKTILHAEVAAAFPESVDRPDGKVARINSDWIVIAADRKMAGLGSLVQALVGRGMGVGIVELRV